MQNIYNYIPKTNYVSKVYSVTPVLWLQFMVHVMLFPMINVVYLYFSTPQHSVQCTMFFFRCLISCFSGMLLRNFLKLSEMVPVDLIITGITFF
jgi:hypothetical protein